MRKIYICSNEQDSIGDVKMQAEIVRKNEGYPVSPYLMLYNIFDKSSHADHKKIIEIGLLLMEKCDGIYVFEETINETMEKQIKHGHELGLEVELFSLFEKA